MPIKSTTQGVRVINETHGLHRGPGRLLGYLAGHDCETAQRVVFYDGARCGGRVLHVAIVHPQQSPARVVFPEPLAFQDGLSVNAGNCEVNVWAAGFTE